VGQEERVQEVVARFFHPAALAWPARLSAASAWNGHIPFAMNLVAVARPALLVELGTHAGSSYCAMCQAVEANRLGTACAAVDTWAGEEHSGFYGREVLNDLRAHHDPRYESFSRLLQMRFDDAAPLFSDGSIDLLHIDGLHTYEAVKGDFDRWLPKMSSRGIVLLHDVVERERGFGVWRLFEELQRTYRCFRFNHSHGLGVVGVGSDLPAPVAALLGAADEEAAVLRGLYEELGRRLQLRLELEDREAARLQAQERSDEEAARRCDAERRLVSAERSLESAGQRTIELDRALRAAEERATLALASADRERSRVDELQEVVGTLTADLECIQCSRSWKAIERWRELRDRVLPRDAVPRRALSSAAESLRALARRGR
jgi:hypothetical protein